MAGQNNECHARFAIDNPDEASADMLPPFDAFVLFVTFVL
jgi:hypothetical protein